MTMCSATDMLPGVRVPTLIIDGDKDGRAPVEQSLEMHEIIEGSRLLIVPGGSYATPIEFPQIMNMGIDLFLRGNGIL